MNWKHFLLMALLVFPRIAAACEPCPEPGKYTLGYLAQKAELIVIGKRHNPPPLNDNNSTDGPAVIEIAVERVLKGNPGREIIKTASWSGMCAYGVILYKEKALLLLRKKQGENSPPLYTVVNEVCGKNQFKVIDNQLTRQERQGDTVANVPVMSVDEFIERYLDE